MKKAPVRGLPTLRKTVTALVRAYGRQRTDGGHEIEMPSRRVWEDEGQIVFEFRDGRLYVIV